MAGEPTERAHEALGQVRDAVQEAVVQAEQAPEVARREVIRWWPRIVAAMALVAVLVAVPTALVVANLNSRIGANEAAVTALRQQAEQAKPAGDQANRELTQRGQPPVPIPEPGTAPDTDVIVAAATARVLASLPNPRPTAAELGQAVAKYLAANPIQPGQPSPTQLAAAIAGYLATSPPPSGPAGPTGPSGRPGVDGKDGKDGRDGVDGQPGPPPTQEEIKAAFDAYLRDNPNAVCPLGGSLAQVTVLLANGGSADVWSCVVATYGPPTTPPDDTDIPFPN
ncbi:hypothetical protein ABZ215_38520 [Amycolatopsis sp. NPDC006131]|uniref:hypothetical protein n=1 Tax=Amycolatopsis sp. NPDC006131 TaxID=3156731 RepID=UPI0033B0A5A8